MESKTCLSRYTHIKYYTRPSICYCLALTSCSSFLWNVSNCHYLKKQTAVTEIRHYLRLSLSDIEKSLARPFLKFFKHSLIVIFCCTYMYFVTFLHRKLNNYIYLRIVKIYLYVKLSLSASTSYLFLLSRKVKH